MPSPKPNAEAIRRVEEQLAEKRALLQRLKRQDESARRKLETRQKIILAGLLLAKARTDPEVKAQVAGLITGITRKQDLGVYEGVDVDVLLAIPEEEDEPARRDPRQQKRREVDGG